MSVEEVLWVDVLHVAQGRVVVEVLRGCSQLIWHRSVIVLLTRSLILVWLFHLTAKLVLLQAEILDRLSVVRTLLKLTFRIEILLEYDRVLISGSPCMRVMCFVCYFPPLLVSVVRAGRAWMRFQSRVSLRFAEEVVSTVYLLHWLEGVRISYILLCWSEEVLLRLVVGHGGRCQGRHVLTLLEASI